MFEALQEPITIAGLAVPNRIVRTAHSLGKPWVDVDDSLVAYHQARARGGVGLSILETGMVHPTAPRPVPSHDDRVLDGYRRLAVAIHRHHSTMMQQLWHGGSSIRNNPLGGSSLALNLDFGQILLPVATVLLTFGMFVVMAIIGGKIMMAGWNILKPKPETIRVRMKPAQMTQLFEQDAVAGSRSTSPPPPPTA